MLADTSLPHGSDASLSTVGSLSQELSHRRITLTACPGRIPLAEQRVLSQLTLLKQSVKRLSRRAQVACLVAEMDLFALPVPDREAMLIGATHLPGAVPARYNEQGIHLARLQMLWSTGANTRRVQPVRFWQLALAPVVPRQ